MQPTTNYGSIANGHSAGTAIHLVDDTSQDIWQYPSVRAVLFRHNRSCLQFQLSNTEAFWTHLYSMNDGSKGLSYELWVKYRSDVNYVGDAGYEPPTNNTRCWALTKEAGWGPAITLNDNRIAKNSSSSSTHNIGVSPGHSYYENQDGHTNPDPFGDIYDHPNELLHIVGYWYTGSGGIHAGNNRKGVFINCQLYTLGGGGAQGREVPHFSNKQNETRFQLGNHKINDNNHGCPLCQFYSFRIWTSRLEEDDVKILYSLGPNGSAV